MGNKLREPSPNDDPFVDPTDKKKKKKKSKSDATKAELINSPVSESTPKRKLEESSTKEKTKKKKHSAEANRVDPISEEAVEDSSKLSTENVVVSGADSGNPKYTCLRSFSDSKLPENVLKCCEGFKRPSAIQAHAWPYLLDGRDFIGIAKTGSGKTLAYGVPAIMHVLKKQKVNKTNRKSPLCLVLAPTRELADQIYSVVHEAGQPCGVTSVCVYGGVPKGPQISSLKAGVDVVIGTPGRLKDLIEMTVCRLGDVSFVVLDEADRMLDMGFRQEVKSILENTSSVRQTIMLSATWPLDVHNLAEEHMKPDPVKIVIGSEDTAANHDVMQIVEVLEDHSRDDRLLALLQKYHNSQKNRVLVFALYQKEAERLEQMVKSCGWKVVGIHGSKAQAHRTKALGLFKDGSCPLMVATDVAARGLDVPDVEVVINYSFPLTTEDYVHRIGRTGRAGKKGVAHTFFTHHNKGLAGELVNVLREAGQVIPPSLLKFGTHVKKKESKLYGSHFKEIKADAPKAKRITFNSDDED